MGLLDSILRKDSRTDATNLPDVNVNDPYSQMGQPFDPMSMQLLNAPNVQANAQIAQFAIDNDDIVENIKEELRGYRVIREFDMDKNAVVEKKIKFGDAVMNDTGINETCRVLRMFLSKPFLLSNFKEEDRYRIDMMMLILWKKLASKYAIMHQAYELDRNRRSDLAFSIVSMVYMNIMRSFEDGERPKMYGSHKTVQSIQQNGMAIPQKKSWSLFG